jgi:hypothetical protein
MLYWSLYCSLCGVACTCYFDDQFLVIFVLNKCPGFQCVPVGWLKRNNMLVLLSDLFSITQLDTTSIFAGCMSMLANKQQVHTFISSFYCL